MERPLPLRGIDTVMEAANRDQDGTIDEKTFRSNR